MGTSGGDETGEASGRKHIAMDAESLGKEVVVETYRAPGPGGQRKNKKETAVRLTHKPTGLTVFASERRSQAMNREIAFERLLKRLGELNRPKKRRIRTRPSPSSVTAHREEKQRQSRKKKLRDRVDISGELH